MNAIDRRLIALLGPSWHTLPPAEQLERITTIRHSRLAAKRPTLEGRPPLSPEKLRKKPYNKPHAHKCKRCGQESSCSAADPLTCLRPKTITTGCSFCSPTPPTQGASTNG